MSVIIRLQNLPWSANSLDIRHYFRGLSIPEGGVHIVGGEMGDAFIAFSTDEDARQAMMLAGGKIKEVQISLMLSSRSEMQKIIEAARQASMSNSLAQLLAPPAVALPQPMHQQQIPGKDLKAEKKDSSDLSSSSHETGSRRDKRDRSRSRSRDRLRKDRRDRDRERDRDRRRRSRSRSRSRERRRRRSKSRSRGRDSHNRDRERKDGKEDGRKDGEAAAGLGAPSEGVLPLSNMDILNASTWIQPAALTQNAQLLTNFELLRNLASQKGPLIPGGPGLLPTPSVDKLDVSGGFLKRSESPGKGDAAKGVSRGGFKNFEDGFGPDGRFDRNRGQKGFQNFGPGFPMRNGGEPMGNNRFGNFGRPDNGFSPRGPGPNRERTNLGRGIFDFPSSGPQRDDRVQGRQERFSNKDDRVDEFGRSIQLRNRKNAANEDAFKEDKFQGSQQNFGFRFGGNQQNPRGAAPPLLRGRDSWPPGGRAGDGFQDRRGFRGSFDEGGRGFRGKGEPFKFHDEDQSQKKDCCVEIRNLSPHIAYGEVRRPFSNLKLIIKEIKFFDYGPNDKKCRIRFLNNEHKKKAIQLSSKILIDHKQVHLLHIADQDFEECIDEGVRRPDARFSDDDEDSAPVSPKDAYVLVKDLAPSVEERDIANLFPNAPLEKVLLETAPDGKSKSAYIKFQKAVDAKVALGTPNRSVGDCPVFLTPLPQHVFNDHLHKAGGDAEGPEVVELDAPEEGPSSCVLVKNLPTEANDRDICDFFSDVGLVPTKIHLMLDVEGQPSGDAFCEFATAAQTERACGKNAAHLGKNIVSVAPVPREEMLEALGVGRSGSPPEDFGRPQCVLSLENIPFRAGPLDIINFFGWSYKLTEDDIMRRYNDRGQPTGDGKVCFRSPEDALRALRTLANRSLMGRVIRMKPL